MTSLPARAAQALARLRETRPWVHCLTNTVVQKFTADGLSALGGVPSMTDSPDEVEAFASRANALLVNLGTLDEDLRGVIGKAVAVASGQGKPIVLDPVFCDVSPVRLAFARQIAGLPGIVLRANAAEIAAIGGSGDAPVIRTGAVDLVQAGGRRATVGNGHPWMAVVVGTGCLSGAIIAAFHAVEDDPLVAGVAGLASLGVAAEMASIGCPGPGTFGVRLLDALHAVSPADIEARARIEELT